MFPHQRLEAWVLIAKDSADVVREEAEGPGFEDGVYTG